MRTSIQLSVSWAGAGRGRLKGGVRGRQGAYPPFSLQPLSGQHREVELRESDTAIDDHSLDSDLPEISAFEEARRFRV
ncbi:hypothetical protein B2D07_08555 [Desulfococcus multivorans]|nr:uncharacterized protein Dmul_17260 [Desulfococcus multivorans]AQV00813.1 hypothetical protein B2D07_08555 [Desulfococcus multivorans]